MFGGALEWTWNSFCSFALPQLVLKGFEFSRHQELFQREKSELRVATPMNNPSLQSS